MDKLLILALLFYLLLCHLTLVTSYRKKFFIICSNGEMKSPQCILSVSAYVLITYISVTSHTYINTFEVNVTAYGCVLFNYFVSYSV